MADDDLSVRLKLIVGQSDDPDAYLPPAARLLQKKQKIKEIEREIFDHKEKFKEQQKELDVKREEVQGKEKGLKENLVKFDKFLRETETKKNRATKKIGEERKLKDAKATEAVSLANSLQVLIVERDKQLLVINQVKKYQQFMDRVIEATGEEFNEPRDIIGRYDTLLQTIRDLQERSKDAQEQQDSNRASLQTMVQDKNNQILSNTNEVAILQSKLEKARLRNAVAQEKWDKLAETASEKRLNLVQVIATTNNLFNIMRNYLGHNLISISEPTKQLSKLETFICDLDWVCSTAMKEFAEQKAKQQPLVAKQDARNMNASKTPGAAKSSNRSTTRTAESRTITTAASSSSSKPADQSKSSLLLNRQLQSRGSMQSATTGRGSFSSFSSERH